jgi:hypothetical protein
MRSCGTVRETTAKAAANDVVTMSKKPEQVGRPLISVLYVRVFFVPGTEWLSVYTPLMGTLCCAIPLDRVSKRV